MNLRKISPKWLTLGLMSAVAVLFVGCQGNQTKIDLPSPSGAPAYLMSVDHHSNVNLFSPEGKPWRECKSRACKAFITADEKSIQRIFESSKATGGFLLLSFDDLKEHGLINFNLFPEAHASHTCEPITIYMPNRNPRIVYPPGCPLP